MKLLASLYVLLIWILWAVIVIPSVIVGAIFLAFYEGWKLTRRYFSEP